MLSKVWSTGQLQCTCCQNFTSFRSFMSSLFYLLGVSIASSTKPRRQLDEDRLVFAYPSAKYWNINKCFEHIKLSKIRRDCRKITSLDYSCRHYQSFRHFRRKLASFRAPTQLCIEVCQKLFHTHTHEKVRSFGLLMASLDHFKSVPKLLIDFFKVI